MLRVRRNCTEQGDYFKQANILKEKFVQQGYRKNTINQIIQEVVSVPREQCFKKKD